MTNILTQQKGRNKNVITAVKGIGPAMADKLHTLGICSALDLLFHLPLRYEDRSQTYPIASLQNGQRAAVEGKIISNQTVFGKRRSLLCQLEDDSGILYLRFFYYSAAQQKNLAPGQSLRCFGEVNLTRSGLTMIHPECEYLANQRESATSDKSLTAIYPSTEGIHQARWRAFIRSAFTIISPTDLEELISPEQRERAGINIELGLYEALHLLHFPPANSDIAALQRGSHPAQRRLALEELTAQRLSHLLIRQQSQRSRAVSIQHCSETDALFRNQLTFTFTDAQNQAAAQILSDLEKPFAMMRLLQGDVGSGKTVVAALCSIQAANKGQQVALMAPTEILAEQHAEAMRSWLEPLGISSTLLLSKLSAKEKRERLESVACGTVSVVIGTHALIQCDVDFKDLVLAIIDEQHRFGVEQRRNLISKRGDGLGVHQLVMTATPIPRTLAMTFYADLDYSVIDQLPPGRKPVKTVAISNERRNDVIERVRQACHQGRQVYWVCTLVDESELIECQAAQSTANELASILNEISLGLVHGRLKTEQKQQVMKAFKQADIQVLVATTVIEVGVDVPNASLMVIENPERLGLAQLHQLRGRVGRGKVESHCVLLYQKPLSKKGKQRLDIMRCTNDGFFLAEQDLKMRGPGEVLGTRQSGAMSMRIADLERDADMIDKVVKLSDDIMQQNTATAKKLISRWCPLGSRYNYV